MTAASRVLPPRSMGSGSGDRCVPVSCGDPGSQTAGTPPPATTICPVMYPGDQAIVTPPSATTICPVM